MYSNYYAFVVLYLQVSACCATIFFSFICLLPFYNKLYSIVIYDYWTQFKLQWRPSLIILRGTCAVFVQLKLDNNTRNIYNAAA
jgi:hypothetical protein